ncbi:hypothetical protein L3Q82_010062, partial [Scortum barcoo]
WSALVFILLSSEKGLDVFDLKKYSASEEALLRLLPVVKASKKALLSGCLITEEGCASLASALKLQPLPSERAGPELQSSRRLRSEAAVCWTGGSTVETGHSFRVEPAGVRWLTPGLRKYSCELTVDTNTVNRKIKLSDNNRKMKNVMGDQLYPDHPDRFDFNGLSCCVKLV